MQDYSLQRDFAGYLNHPPQITWPKQARVAVSFVVNVEEGAELSMTDGDECNDGVHETSENIGLLPDLCQDSHYEFGTRAGYWRIMNELAAHNASATMNICGRAIERSPWLAQDAAARGHELACHGWRWDRHASMNEEKERVAIARSVMAIQQAAGITPVGWHTRSASSPNTRRLLLEHGGFLYDSDAYCDDLPFSVQVQGKKHIVLPYSFDTNDMNFHGNHRFVSASDFAGYVIDAYERLWEEGEDAPRMLSVGLHLRIIGRAGRINGLRMILNHIAQRGGAWIARRDSIAQHWLRMAT